MDKIIKPVKGAVPYTENDPKKIIKQQLKGRAPFQNTRSKSSAKEKEGWIGKAVSISSGGSPANVTADTGSSVDSIRYRGGWGAVRVGVFREQRVAVKQLHEVIVSENNLAVMNREINTMSKLHHPNLLLFIGAVLDDPSKNPLIITEIMDTSLRQAYEKGQLTDKSTKLSVLRDTAAGLNYLHCHPDEIIHRDVSSANVLLESRGPNKWRAKLSDFGSVILLVMLSP